MIPLKNLNCTHCALRPKCGQPTNPATGQPCLPEEHYCIDIFKNYSEEEVK